MDEYYIFGGSVCFQTKHVNIWRKGWKGRWQIWGFPCDRVQGRRRTFQRQSEEEKVPGYFFYEPHLSSVSFSLHPPPLLSPTHPVLFSFWPFTEIECIYIYSWGACICLKRVDWSVHLFRRSCLLFTLGWLSHLPKWNTLLMSLERCGEIKKKKAEN